MPSSFRPVVGAWVRAVYSRLPVSPQSKMAVKGWLFTVFAPLVRDTDAYRRWRAFHIGPDSAPALSGVKAVSASGGCEPRHQLLDRYVSDLMRQTPSGYGVDYIEMPKDLSPPDAVAAKAIAFYLPQFHPIPENDEWWGRGFTEWTNVSKALPQFIGHYQPRLPGELGFYDLRLVDVMRRQAELARLYGVHGFCFHYYWFSGRRLLERPVDQLLANADIDLPYCLCWANENWTRRWDGDEQDVLLGQSYTVQDDHDFIADTLKYLQDPRYIRINGKPLLIVYRPSLLPDIHRTLKIWRDYCRDQGLGELFIAMVQFDVDDPRPFGFDAALEFPPHKIARRIHPINHRLQFINKNYQGNVVEYAELVDNARKFPVPDYPMFRGVAPSWDNEARKPGKGYTFANSTPALYREWLSDSVDYAQTNPIDGEKVVFVNAWNEWAEGAHLEPDRRFGYAYLQATRDALSGKKVQRKVLVVSHDAHPHGAQYLALNLVRELVQGLGLEVEVWLQGGGRLEKEFAALAPIHKPYESGEDPAVFAAGLARRGFGLAIANTAVAGRVVAPLREAGMQVVSLVHELPGVIREYGLEQALQSIADNAGHVVVAAEAVGKGLEEFIDTKSMRATLITRPQGLFTRSRYRGLANLSEARTRLRMRLGLPADSRIVLSVGYADRRKGVDLLAKAAVLACERDPNLHVVWVGHRDTGMHEEIESILRRGECESRFHFVGLDFDTDDYYAGADVYALASREDPFPSVVLESLSVGTPVVAFAGTGGGADLVGTTGGATVPAFNVAAYADALIRIVRDAELRERLGTQGAQLIDADFSFRGYAMDLLKFGGMSMPRVSVVVPNYNYAHYMAERLGTVAEQTVPLYEIIVLDDCSTDDSLEVLQQLRGRIRPEPRIFPGTTNSGSVFKQWLKGVERARGDYVWIAEADDLSKPEFLERLLQLLSKHPDAVMAYSQSEQIDEYGQVLAPNYLGYTDDLSMERWLENYVADGRSEASAGLAVKNTIPNVSAVLFRREPLLRVLRGHIDEIASCKIAGDWLLYLKLLQQGNVAFEARSSNSHRRHSSSVTLGSNVRLHYDEVVRVQKAAQKMFVLDSHTLSAADAYAKSLREHFGLSDYDGEKESV